MSNYKKRPAPVIWRPQPKQAAFMRRPEFEALYGGAAGGGKSDALLAEALRQVDIPHYKALILRKTYPQLTELIDRSRTLYGAAFPAARYNATGHVWSFPSGAKIYFGSMQRAADKINYQGKAYDFIAFDELTHFSWEEYSYLFSRCRPTGPGTRCYIRATTNPGGIGHAWVKERFISAAAPLTTITEESTVPDGKGGTMHIKRDRVFVPSTVYDNRALLANDPGYLANLAMLPEAERNALLLGSWDSFDGQVFCEWRNDPAHYLDHCWTHVISPFDIPPEWRVMRCFDFGYTHPYSVHWLAYDTRGKMYAIRELYGTDGTPNRGNKFTPVQIAAEIRRIEQDDPMLRGRKIWGVADPAIFDASRGESIADMMAAAPNFILWDKGDNARIAGKMQWHYRLAFDESGEPMFQAFEGCKHLIRTIPALVYSQSNVEDIDTDGEDHAYDALRYAFMERPIAPRKHTKPTVDLTDPFSRGQETVRPHDYFRI